MSGEARCGARDWIQVIKGEPPHAVGPCVFAAGHGGRCRDEAGNWWYGVNQPVAAAVQVADDLRMPVEGERAEVGGVKITRHSLFGPHELPDRLFEIGTLLDLPGADCRDAAKVSAAARERIPAWRDYAREEMSGLNVILGELRSRHAIVEAELADQRRVYGEACAELAVLRDRLAAAMELAADRVADKLADHLAALLVRRISRPKPSEVGD